MGRYLETFEFLAKLIERLFNLEENFKDAHGQERCFVGAFKLCTFIKVKDVNLGATLVCDFCFWEKRLYSSYLMFSLFPSRADK